jgi:O-antigen ligase
VAFAPLAAASPQLAAQALLGLVAIAVVLRSLLAGMALFVVLTFPDQLPGVLGAGPTLAKPLGLVIVASWLLVVLSDTERQVPFLPRDAPLVTAALLALVVWSLASATWAADPRVTLSSTARLAQLVALVFVIYTAVRKASDVLVLVGAFLVGAVVTSTYALANGTLRAGRLTGGIFNPNTLAAELAVALILTMFLFVSAPRFWQRLLLLVCAGIFAVGFAETQSRSGLIGLGCAAMVAVVVAGPARGRILAVVLVAAAIGVGYYVFAAPPQLRERVTSIVTGGQASPLREDTWQIALRMSRDHPVGGVGLGNFRRVESKYFAGTLDVQQVGSLRRFELVAHSTYLEALAELGIIGLGLLVVVLAVTVGRAASIFLRPHEEGRARFLTRALVAATAAVLTSHIFNSGQYSKLLWLLLGMSLSAAALASHPARRRLGTSAEVRRLHVSTA